MALIYDVSFDSQTRVLSLLDKAGNVISSCEVPSKELVDNPNKPLMLRAIADNSYVTLKKNGTLSNTYQTSTNGKDWTNYTLGTGIRLNNEDVVYFRCSNHPTTQSNSNYVQFVMTGKIEAWHNAYSMISSDFSSAEGSVGEYGMRGLFERCASLMKAPLLLNALADHCYIYMFVDCTYLTQAPSLPATTLANYCYYDMFRGCTSLVKTPALPATTGFYYSNWIYCYYGMFNGCTALNEVHVSATSIRADRHTEGWLTGVPKTGDFYCDPNASWISGASGIPYGWKRWVYGVEDTGTTTTMYHNGVAETVRVGTSSYGTCYALQGWTGFRTLAQMHDLGYILQEPVPTTMYHNGSTETIGKIEANGADGFTEDMYILNSSFKTLSEMHALGHTLGAQTAITMYDYSDPVSAYSCAANVDDGFTETMYDIGDGEGYLTIAQQNAKHYYLVSTEFDGLVLTATADNSSVALTKNGTLSNTYEVSMGDGSGWHSYKLGNTINLNKGDKCLWRCSNHPTTQSSSNFVQFVMTGTIEATGDSLSMLSPDFSSLTSVPMYGLYKLFMSCTSLTKAPSIRTSIGIYGCASMFEGCTGLADISDIPSLKAVDFGASRMFYGCTSIVDVSNMSCIGKTSGKSTGDACCLQSMFEGCTSLVYPPSSVSVSHTPTDSSLNMMARHAARMFYGCTSLRSLPSLHMSKVNYAFESMFEGCTSLTEASVPFDEFDYYVYYESGSGSHPEYYTAYCKGVFKRMFAGCTGLTSFTWVPFIVTIGDSGKWSYSFTSAELYMEMFSGCTALSSVSEFKVKSYANAMRLSTSDYGAPKTSANNSDNQYTRMFENCTSLVSFSSDSILLSYNGAPLTEMFKGCTQLQKPPAIYINGAISTFDSSVFTSPSNMFIGCTSVNEILVIISNASSVTTMDNWLPDVPNSGVIYSSGLSDVPIDSADGIPIGWSLKERLGSPLTFTSRENGSSVTLNSDNSTDKSLSYEYSTDGETWQAYTLGTTINADLDDTVSFRCSSGTSKYYYFTTPSGSFDVSGNPSINKGFFAPYRGSETQTSTKGVFEGTNIVNVQFDGVYYNSGLVTFTRKMFYKCSMLVSVPDILSVFIATKNLQTYFMFGDCTSLTVAPILPLVIKTRGYMVSGMFSGCTSLTEVTITATDESSGSGGYNFGNIVSGCSSLQKLYWYTNAGLTVNMVSNVPANVDIYTDRYAQLLAARDVKGGYGASYNSGFPSTWKLHVPEAMTWGATLTNTQQENNTVQINRDYNQVSSSDDFNTDVFLVSKDGLVWESVTSYTLEPLETVYVCIYPRYRRVSKAYTEPDTRVISNYSSISCSGDEVLLGGCLKSLGRFTKTEPSDYADGCFAGLFMSSKLKYNGTLPLPQSKGCYARMFSNRTDLVEPPSFLPPLTSVSEGCYSQMFTGCTSLKKAPELPAMALRQYCYSDMFNGCSALNEVRIKATATGSYALSNWLSGVSATGDFYCDPSATIFPTDNTSGIPANWRRLNINDYPVTP